MKQIVVLGGGISGYGSAILAKKKGFGVFLSDAGRIADRYKAKLDEWEVPYEEGGHTEERILAATEVVKSPGIPDTAPMVRKIREAGIPVISEMEFAGRYMGKAKCICITGSNGKTTTTSLIYKVGRYGRLRLVCTGIEFFPVGRNVSVPGACRGADEHYARSPRPLRPLFSELCRLENENRAEYDLARLVRLLGR